MVAEGQTHPHVEWLGTCDYTADGALAANAERSENPGALEEAMAFLEETLADGPIPAGEMKRMAARAGITNVTLRRARRQRCVVDKRPPYNWTLQNTPDEQEGGRCITTEMG